MGKHRDNLKCFVRVVHSDHQRMLRNAVLLYPQYKISKLLDERCLLSPYYTPFLNSKHLQEGR